MLRKKNYILLLIIIQPALAFAQEANPPTSTRSASVYYPGKDNRLKLKYEYVYDFWSRQEIWHGRFSHWTRSGVMRYDTHYLQGKLSGARTFYTKKGALKRTENWKSGYLHGKTHEFDRKGRLRKITPFEHNKKNGLVKRLFPNGRIKSVHTFQAGKKDGLAAWYDKKGNLLRQKTYLNGQKERAKASTEDKAQPASLQPTTSIQL